MTNEIIARYPDEYRTLDQLDQIRVQTDKGLVPIGNFVKREAKPKVGTISRVDSKRVMTVKANVRDGVLVVIVSRDDLVIGAAEQAKARGCRTLIAYADGHMSHARTWPKQSANSNFVPPADKSEAAARI